MRTLQLYLAAPIVSAFAITGIVTFTTDAATRIEQATSVQAAAGNCLSSKGDPASIARNCTLALSKRDIGSARHAALLSARGAAYTRLEEHAKALEDHAGAVAFDPYSAAHLGALGWAQLRLMRIDQALVSFERALAIVPDNRTALSGKASALRTAGDYQGALETLLHAQGVLTDDDWITREIGWVLLELEQAEEALVWLEQAALLAPDDAWAYFALGWALDDLVQFEDALAAFDQAIALDPEVASFHWLRAHVLRGLGLSDEALAALDRARDLDPGNSDIHRVRGWILYDAGRIDESIAEFLEAMDWSPLDARPHYGLARALHSVGKTKSAFAAVDQAIRLGHSGGAALKLRGLMHLEAERLQLAVEDFDAALEADPLLIDAEILRAEALIEIGREEDTASAGTIQSMVPTGFAASPYDISPVGVPRSRASEVGPFRF